MLSTHYPKCFFEEGRQRRPLKLGIATNIIADKDFDANPELIAAGVDWYISHISYQISLSVAGSDTDSDTENQGRSDSARVYRAIRGTDCRERGGKRHR